MEYPAAVAAVRIFAAYIKFGLLRRHIGTFKTAKEAAIARDQYIIDNNLPHRLQVLTRD